MEVGGGDRGGGGGRGFGVAVGGGDAKLQCDTTVDNVIKHCKRYKF